MRSAQELIFRAKQELNNLHLWLRPPSAAATSIRSERLPDGQQVGEALKRTTFHAETVRLADSILEHHIPVGGTIVDTGPAIDWRRDYRQDVVSGTQYFRFVPYLDVARVGDHKVVWDLSRHQHLVVLAQAFVLTGRDVYVEEVQRQLDGWIDANPYMRGINWTSALEVAFRTLSWIWILHLTGSRLGDRTRRRLADELYKHGRYLANNLSVYFSPNTHLLGEAVALHALGTLFPEFPSSEQWRESAGAMVMAQMRTQVREDGSHFEESAYYHVYALDFFLFHQILSETTDAFRAKLWRMADYLDAIMGPMRRLPLIGDDDGGRMFHPYGSADRFGRATLATSAVLLNETKWGFDECDVYDQAAWLIGPQVVGRSQKPSSRSSELFARSGIAAMTSGSAHVIFDGGSFGGGSGGHSHSDALSLVVRTAAEDLLIDPGTYTYVAEPALRDWFRGSAGHNTVRIDGHDQAMAMGPFRWSRKAETTILKWVSTVEYDFVAAACRYSSGVDLAGLEHRREVLLIKRPPGEVILMVRDQLEGIPGTHRIEQTWHPGSETTLIAPHHCKIGQTTDLIVPDGSTLAVTDGWRSQVFGNKRRSPMLVVVRDSDLPVTLWACVPLGSATQRPAVFHIEQRRARIEWPDELHVTADFRADGDAVFFLGLGS